MNIYYTIKKAAKQVRWRVRRVKAARRWDPEKLVKSPIVLGNAMPKSGSHLIIQVLRGLTEIGPFVDPGFPPVNRNEDNTKLSEEDILANIAHMQPGDIGYGYIGCQEPFVDTLTQHNRATVFVFRDPRDMIISQIFYATEMHIGHWMHEYYTKELQTTEERIDAAIKGVQVPGSELTPVRKRYEDYLGWLDIDSVLCLRFEDLILERAAALRQLLHYLSRFNFKPVMSEVDAVEILSQAVAPKKSGTFRKGNPGNWREHFTDSNKENFKQETGDLLYYLGYEVNEDW